MSDALVTRVPTGGNGGRTRLYQVEEPGLRLIEDLAANGVNIRTIAHRLRMDPTSFRNARDRQPEIDEAIGRGAARLKDELVGLVVAHARGGNLVAAMFALKAIYGLRDAGPVRPDGATEDGPTGGVLIVPAELTVAEYLAQKVAAGDLERHPHLIDVTPRSE